MCGPAGAIDGCDQARVRVDVQSAREGVCTRDTISAGRREDGGDSAAGGGERACGAILSGFFGSGTVVEFLSDAPSTSEDGIATVALGLGRAVVDGGKCLMFSPRYPQNLVQFSSVDDMLTNSQSEFWAIDVSEEGERTVRRRGSGIHAARRGKRWDAACGGVDIFAG